FYLSTLSSEPLLERAEQIPSERHEDNSIFLLATAGVRRLRVMMQLGFSKMQKLLLMCRKTSIRILTGQEEAYYILPVYPLLGVLDLGCSSLQVVMEIKELTDDKFTVAKIWFSSASNFGIFTAQIWSKRESVDCRFQLRHPCLSVRFVLNHSCDSCYLQHPHFKQYCWSISKKSAAATHSKNFDWSRLTEGKNCKGRSSSSNSTYSNLLSVPHLVSRKACKYVLGRGSTQRKFLETENMLINSVFEFHIWHLSLRDAEINFGPGDVSWTFGAALTGSYNLKLTKVIPYPISLFMICLCLVLIVYGDRVRQTALLLVSVPGKMGASTRASLPSYLMDQNTFHPIVGSRSRLMGAYNI
ncbi:hypothetical protein C5167_042342, partial [Papaver somniferum]